METLWLKTVLCLEISVCVMWGVAPSLHGHPSRAHDKVLNLLAFLNTPPPIKGVSKIEGEAPGTVAYKLRSRAPYLTLPADQSHAFAAGLQGSLGSLGVHLVGRQTLDSHGVLLSLFSASSSSLLLRLSSSTRSDLLRLDYRAKAPGRGLASVLFPGGSPFSGGGWVRVALGVEAGRLVLFVDCREAVVVWRSVGEGVELELPADLGVTLASTQGDSDSRFTGYLQTAEISSKAYQRRPWHCDNVTDVVSEPPAPESRTESEGPPGPQQDVTRGRLLTDPQPREPQPREHQPREPQPREPQGDQPKRGVVLGPPGSPQAGRPGPAAPGEERLRGLEERLLGLTQMLDMVKAQNADLETRVKHLEGCECVRRQCVWEGRHVEEGHRWETHLNTVCTCAGGQVTCVAPSEETGCRGDTTAPFLDACASSPCRNGGACLARTSDSAFHCYCPAHTTGALCDRQQTQVTTTFGRLEACWWPRQESNCRGHQLPQQRWFFNTASGLCEDFLYCAGNGANHFLSLSACQEQCMLGACCFRQHKASPPVDDDQQDHNNGNQGYNISSPGRTFKYHGSGYHGYEEESFHANVFNLTRLPSQRKRGRRRERRASQEGSDCRENDVEFTYTCERLSLRDCQARVQDLRGKGEPVSFSLGGRCSDAGCGQHCGCFSQGRRRRLGERFRQGCEECVCASGGKVECVCTQATQRKEVRDLTLRERRRYQRAVRRLHAKSGVWEGFAQLRAEFSPQAGSHAYFLPWHRYFLRLVERELQSLSSCQLAVPYLEWTVDVGSLRTSAAWQAGLYGGDGDPGGDLGDHPGVGGCVPQHPFQGWAPHSHWNPCLRRSFNTSVWLPDAVTLQRVLNQGDFLVFSQALQAFSGLFRLWLGGHMATPLAAYDPVYLSHAAFLDKLWAQWQEKHGEGDSCARQGDARAHVHTRQGDSGAHVHARYPAKQRCVKMMPFGIAPDDVMSSREQLCVVYVPITLGAPCNLTSSRERPRKGNATESDHHSHKKGFDFRPGRFDDRGFDRSGYDDSGFDRSGWDRQGYGRDGFDRDHIDREGYDVSGYNRYGFNRSNLTRFGMRWDGVFMTEEEGERETEEDKESEREEERVRKMSEVFGDGGYSVHGFDPFGLDRGGFDAFGFQPDGYDKDHCNWFFNGPHYLRFYFHTQQQLSSTSPLALDHVTRTCPPISELPQYWLRQDWMALDSGESNALVGHLQLKWTGQKADRDHRTQELSQGERGVWLPITPDRRLCFDLHWFSGCPLGFAPMMCPDLCRDASCHGYPEAECRVHNCGSCFSEWLDPSSGSLVLCQDW